MAKPKLMTLVNPKYDWRILVSKLFVGCILGLLLTYAAPVLTTLGVGTLLQPVFVAVIASFVGDLQSWLGVNSGPTVGEDQIE